MAGYYSLMFLFKKQLHKKQNLGKKKYGIKCSKF